jgi:hypothetical protein
MDSTLLLQHNGRYYLTAHAELVTPDTIDMASWTADSLASMNPAFKWVAGRFVEADKPNLNKQYWSTSDLEFAHSTIRYTPMNMLHQIKNPVGVYTEAQFVPASDTANAHVTALGCLWAHRFPNEAALVEMANDAKQLFYSMECVGEKLHCKGGCEEEFPYFSRPEDLCDHLQNRTSVRHIVNPTFTGGAIIIPPTRPAWPDAEVEQIAALTATYASKMDDDAEQIAADDDSLTPGQARALLDLVIAFAARK